MSPLLPSCLSLVLALNALAAFATDAPSVANEKFRTQQLQSYMQTASETLAAEQVDALMQIKDEDRRYLAMTYYLRAGRSIASHWSWTSDQINAYEQSKELTEVLAEIEKIAARFAAENPPYTLYANTQIRSLEEQLKRWQTVRSIGVAAREFRSAALSELAKQSYPSTPNGAATKRFRIFLSAWRASPRPTLTAPGLSLHGRGRAYDFQIRDKQGRTIADTDTSTIDTVWEGQGWAEKLSHAVHAASDKFVGPLTTPREPWHYEYRPEGSAVPDLN